MKPFFVVARCIPIDIDNFNIGALKDINDCLKRGELVSMFPEGHINDGSGEMRQFKSGMVLMAMRADVPIIKHPIEKDDTDLSLAAEAAIARGVTELYVYAALGGRLDHTVANLQLLASLATRGIRATLIGADGVAVTALSEKQSAHFTPRTGIFSVFAHGGPCEGVSLSGVKYPLSFATLTPDRPLGISNEFVKDAATVSLVRGTLLLFYSTRDGDMPTVF